MKKAITLILTGKVPLISVWYFVQGHARYKLYYSKYKWLLRKHIREQIEFRIKAMRPTCFNNGSCDICGCQTTMLQMANKGCEGECYPPMFKAGTWRYIKSEKWSAMKAAYPYQNHLVFDPTDPERPARTKQVD